MKPKVQFQWIRDKSYQEVWDIQTSYHKQLVDEKLRKRNFPIDQLQQETQKNKLIFCEHSHVFTLGKSGTIDHLLLDEKELSQGAIEFFKINRGGDITYHGPGQITGYPVFDLDEFFTDVHRYVRTLEACIISFLALYDLEGIRIPNFTGVWLPPDAQDGRYKKICAIGVHLSRWVSMHGFAFNINTDLSYFDKIIPCGIEDENKTVTSLAKETGTYVPIEKAGNQLATIFSEIFEFDFEK